MNYVIMVVYNRKEATRKSLLSIEKAQGDFVFVGIDNCSEDGAGDVMNGSKIGTMTIKINLRENIGLTRASNVGLSLLSNKNESTFTRINNDVEVMSDNWIERMSSLCVGDVGIVAPCYDDPGAFIQQRYDRGVSGVEDVSCVVGHCMMISGKMLRCGFKWEENFGIVGPCDLDACMFAISHGLKILVCNTVRMKLIDCPSGPSYWKDGESAKWHEDRNYLKKKYGDDVYNIVTKPYVE